MIKAVVSFLDKIWAILHLYIFHDIHIAADGYSFYSLYVQRVYCKYSDGKNGGMGS